MKFGYGKNRPVLLLAPDAVVIINQDLTLPVCRACGASSNIVDLVTRVSINSSIDSTPGTATFDLVVPKHSSSQVYEQGKLNIPLLSEVEILIKGRFLGTNNQPLYYRVFWGLIMGADYSYSDGAYTIHVSCDDMLRWWDISKVITQDSTLNSVYTSQPFKALSNVYSYLTPDEVIYALSIAMYEDNAAILSANLSNPDFATKTYASAASIYSSALDYWKRRFSSLSAPGQLNIFSLDGKDIQDANGRKPPSSEKALRLWRIRQAILGKNVQEIFKPGAGASVVPNLSIQDDIRTGKLQGSDLLNTLPLFSEFSGSFDSTQLGTKSPLEIAKEVCERIDFEFFMDTGGTITFKPPLFNMQTKSNQIYRISDLDLISYSIAHSYDNIYTRIDVKGSFTADSSMASAPSTFYMDPILVKKYGVKQIEKSYNYISNDKTLRFKAIHDLNRMNSKEYTGTITIAGRPEVRLGTSVFLECENIYAYVTGVTHEFDFGQSFTTTLTISTIRRSGVVAGARPKSYLKIRKVNESAADLAKIAKEQLSKNTALAAALAVGTPARAISFIKNQPDLAGAKPEDLLRLLSEKNQLDTYIQSLSSDTTNPDLQTIATYLKPISNILKAAEVNYFLEPVSNPDLKDQQNAYFQRYDEDDYELIFGLSYGLGYFPSYEKSFPNRPVDITSAQAKDGANMQASAKPTSCKCTT